jgi:hypothetical protein
MIPKIPQIYHIMVEINYVKKHLIEISMTRLKGQEMKNGLAYYLIFFRKMS